MTEHPNVTRWFGQLIVAVGDEKDPSELVTLNRQLRKALQVAIYTQNNGDDDDVKSGASVDDFAFPDQPVRKRKRTYVTDDDHAPLRVEGEARELLSAAVHRMEVLRRNKKWTTMLQESDRLHRILLQIMRENSCGTHVALTFEAVMALRNQKKRKASKTAGRKRGPAQRPRRRRR
jgi:protein involved in temperature-dependent protein secretion